MIVALIIASALIVLGAVLFGIALIEAIERGNQEIHDIGTRRDEDKDE